MSWLYDWAKRFSTIRASSERVPTPLEVGALSEELQYLALVITGTITPHFYMEAEELLKKSAEFHKMMSETKREYAQRVIRGAREKGVKDQVLLGSLFLFDSETLSSFPPKQVLKLLKWCVANKRAKHIIKEYLSRIDLDYYVESDRRPLKELIFKTHAKIPSEIMDRLMNPLKSPKNFNYIRTSIPKEQWPSDMQISAYAVLSMAKSLAERFGEDWMVERLREAKYLTSDKYFNALLALSDSQLNKVTQRLTELYENSVQQSYKEFLLDLPIRRVRVVIDVSASMRNYFTRVMSMISPFALIIDRLVLFSDRAYLEDKERLMSVEGIKQIEKNAPFGATNVRSGINLATQDLGDQTILLVTDEQENIGTSEPIQTGNPMFLVNPTPYPSHIPLKNVYYLPAMNTETLGAALRFVQIMDIKKVDTIISTLHKD